MQKERIIIVNQGISKRKGNPEGRVFLTSSAAEGAAVLLNSDARIIEFWGGDGTFSSTLDEALVKNPSFLEGKQIKIHPGGTGNDRHKSLREIFSAFLKDKNRSPAVFTSDGHHCMSDDYLVATINGKYRRHIFNIGGIGLDSQTLIAYDNFRKKRMPSSLKYFGAAIQSISRLNGYQGSIEYTTDSKCVEKAGPIMFLFMLGRYFGGGMSINSRLIADDGLFEAVILNRASKFELYRSLAAISLLKQPQYNNPVAKYLDPAPVMELLINSGDAFWFESDGEVFTVEGNPLKVSHLKVETAGKITYLLD